MTERDLVHQNKILEMVSGSHLYGTNTETSDMDKIGIFIPSLEYFFGLKSIEEVDLSVISKNDDGKNNSDAEDIKFYSLNKFVKLAIENNPNILDQMFCNKQNLLFSNDIGEELLNIRHLFPHKGLVKKYIGYAMSQSHKMTIKVSNYDSFKIVLEWLEDKMYTKGDNTKYASSQLLAEFRTSGIEGIKFYDHHATIGDINISLTDKLSKVYSKVVDRLSKVGNREELYTKYGFDTKFGMHCLRLLIEGKELMTTGTLEFPLKEKDFLLDVRSGKYSKEDIINMMNESSKELEDLTSRSKLPDKPRHKEIEMMLIRMNTKFLL